MLTRRGFVGCALCALSGFSATEADAQAAQTPGLKRTIISRTDGPAAGYETIEAKVEIPAGSVIARHIHFGIETSYLVEGSIELDVQGVGPKTYAAGQGFQVPTATPHGGKGGDKPTVLIGVFVVEKGKPLATPA
ncbi:MAG: cupin domain-containing protein [Pseudomonadota bacterium]|nr:cupin domain-containing protein [Pseudomonadota bacterium]